MNFHLIYPMFAMVLLTFVVGTIALAARVRAARKKDVSMKYFKLMDGEAPEYMIKPIRHFNNLFETPILFYAGCFSAILTQAVDLPMMILAWAYVALRVAHALIHIGPNKVMPRMFAFLGSFAVILTMWILVVVHIS